MQFIYDFDFKSEEKEIVKRWLYSYKINLTSYSKKGMHQAINFTGQEKSFNCNGTSVSPAILTITSNVALASLTIECVKLCVWRLGRDRFSYRTIFI